MENSARACPRDHQKLAGRRVDRSWIWRRCYSRSSLEAGRVVPRPPDVLRPASYDLSGPLCNAAPMQRPDEHLAGLHLMQQWSSCFRNPSL